MEKEWNTQNKKKNGKITNLIFTLDKIPYCLVCAGQETEKKKNSKSLV